MDADKASAGLDVAHQCDPLRIGVKYVVVGVRKHQCIILLQVIVGEHGRVIGGVNGKSEPFTERFQRLNGIFDVVVHIALTVFGIHQDFDFSPIDGLGQRPLYSGQQDQHGKKGC